MADSGNESYLDKIVEMHLKSLEDLVNVNSLFTVAVFIGLSLASPDQRSLDSRRECDPDSAVLKSLVMYEVLSFSLFLVSSLAAKSLKVLLSIYKLEEEYEIEIVGKFGCHCLKNLFMSLLWRRTLLLISTGASALGVFFLTLSMINVTQIRLGKLSCGSVYTLKSVASLALLVISSLILYLPPMFWAAIAKFKIKSRVIQLMRG